MLDQNAQDRPHDAIEEMPAAPEADQGTRDADAPTWSAPTEGHVTLPLTPAAEPPAAEPPAAEPPAVAAPAFVSADHVRINQAGAQRIEGREITITQGGAGIIRGDHVRIEQGGALAIIGRRITMRESGAFIVLARRTEGSVNVAFDWRALAAIFIALIALTVVRGRR